MLDINTISLKANKLTKELSMDNTPMDKTTLTIILNKIIAELQDIKELIKEQKTEGDKA